MSFLSNLFGGNKAPQINYTPSGISNPTGFSVGAGGSISQSPTLTANIGGLQQTFANQASAFGNLAKTVQPGFSQLRRAGLNQISNTFRANRANLQQNLAQRRILGSSFANSAFSENAANEAQAKANFAAQSYLQELNASNQLIQEQYSAASNQFTTAINQSNIEAATAASLVSSINNTSAQMADAQANLDAKAAAGAGSFVGTLLGLGTGGGQTLGGSIFSGIGAGLSSLGSSIFGAGTAAAGSAAGDALDLAMIGAV